MNTLLVPARNPEFERLINATEYTVEDVDRVFRAPLGATRRWMIDNGQDPDAKIRREDFHRQFLAPAFLARVEEDAARSIDDPEETIFERIASLSTEYLTDFSSQIGFERLECGWIWLTATDHYSGEKNFVGVPTETTEEAARFLECVVFDYVYTPYGTTTPPSISWRHKLVIAKLLRVAAILENRQIRGTKDKTGRWFHDGMIGGKLWKDFIPRSPDVYRGYWSHGDINRVARRDYALAEAEGRDPFDHFKGRKKTDR